ncbi:hypothetical protein DSL72_002268 [Monilinia vaccinii-corymbosi]|uniref:Phytocyanin domain-containing protein n=1 Tax=Monilinia vaccinii-corymbosi TaxID=61207 RepID=A0A8A3PC72_9HELO|nr:hypothetical protein DSL72_002268 [Monilinia vaccinii-corymbosi]
MLLSKVTFFLGALPFTLAADSDADTSTSSEATPSTTTSTSPSDPTHTILVGADAQLTFSPNETKADVNTTLEFQFYPPTHSVAQAAFESPCSDENPSVFSVLVNDTAPIWFYCGFPGHCEEGMVGAVNVPTNDNTKTLAQFAAAAENLKSDSTKNPPGLVGGTFAPVKAGSSSSGTSTTAASSSSSSTMSSGSSSSTTGSGSSSSTKSSATATTMATSASASPSSGAGLIGVGWTTFAGALGVAGLLGM